MKKFWWIKCHNLSLIIFFYPVCLSFFCRVVQILLEQSSDSDYLMARLIRIYVPYWISFSRLPPLTLRLIDISGRKEKRRLLSRSHLERGEKQLYDIKHDELVEGYTIASGLNFKGLGLLSSVGHGGRFGSVKELSPLGDMVSLDLLFFFFLFSTTTIK